MNAEQKLQQLRKELSNAIDRFEASEFFEKMPDVIRERTRNGYGITGDNGKIVSLPDLAESTIMRREYLERKGELSNETTPFLSNFTESGTTLDALKFKKEGKKYVLSFDNRRKRKGKTPEQIKNYGEEKGFKFFGLAKSEREQLMKNVSEKLEKAVKKIFR
jgi:hypothetical protein